MGLIGITFGLVVWAVMNVTGTYLVNQRVSEELSVVDALALEVTSDVREANADALYETLVERGRENDARLLVTDETGTVWVDSLSELNGVRLGHGEITDITSQQMDRSYGFHRVQSEEFTLSNGEWIGYYTCAVTDNGRLIGTVMMVSSLQDLTRSLDEIQNNPAWQEVRAVQEGRVYTVPREYSTLKPNARYPEAFAYFAEKLYGDAS